MITSSKAFEDVESKLLLLARDNYALDYELIQRIKSLSEGNKVKEAIASYFEALYLFYGKSDLKGALSVLCAVTDTDVQLLSPIYRAKFKNLSGAAYSFFGEVNTAKLCYLGALEILLNTSHGIPEYRLLSLIYLNLHQINLSSESPKIEYLQQAMKYAEKSKDNIFLANCYNGYGHLYFLEEKYHEAIHALELAKSFYAKESGRLATLTYSNLGMVYARVGNKEKALDQFAFVERSLMQHPDVKSEAILHVQYGLIFIQLEEYEKAFASFHKAIDLNKRNGFLKGLCDCYSGLEKLFIKQENYKLAHEYLTLKSEVGKILIEKRGHSNVSRSLYEFELDQKSKEVEMLKSLNNELNQFAYIASHDLKEPLRMISMYADLLKRNLRSKNLNGINEEEEYLQEIKVASNRMNGLIHDLLQFTRISSDLSIEEISLEEVVKSVMKNLQTVYSEKVIEVSYEILPMIEGVRSHIIQLFQNLFSNSIKHNLNQKVCIKVMAHYEAESLHIIVSDNGIGVPEAYREKVFKLFQRLNNELTGSTGIGLAICKKIVELMEGNIWIESNSILGSDFNIKLPIKKKRHKKEQP